MPKSPEKNGKKHFPARIIIQILIFLLLSALTALAFTPVQGLIQNEMREMRDKIMDKAEAAIGCTIQYDSIRPGLISAFDIRGIRIFAGDEGARQLVSIARLRISYSLWDLLLKNKRAIHLILIDRPYIEIDMLKDSPVFEKLAKLADNNSLPIEVDGQETQKQVQEILRALLPEQTTVKVRGGRCAIQSGGEQFRLSGGYCDIRTGKSGLTLSGRGTGNVSSRHIPVLPLDAAFNIRLNGAYSLDSGEGNVRILIPYVSAESFRLHPLAFELALRDNALYINNQNKNLSLRLSAEYSFDTGAFSALYSCDKLPLGDMVSFDGKMKQAKSWLSLASSGEASFSVSARNNFQYRVAMDSAAPPASGSGEFSLHARGNGKLLRIDNFHVLAPNIERNAGQGSLFRGAVDFRGDIGLQPLLPNGVFTLSGVTFSDNETLDGEFIIDSQRGMINIFCQTFSMGTVSLDALDAAIIPGEKSLGFVLSALRFRNLESYTNVKISTLSLDGAIDYGPAQVSASLRLDSFSVTDLEGMMRPFAKSAVSPLLNTGLLKNVLITTEIFFDTNFERVLYNAPRFIIALESRAADDTQFLLSGFNPGGIRNAVGLFSVSGTDGRINLSEGRFLVNDNLLSLNGFADYTNPMAIDFSFMSNYRDISYYLEGFLLDRRHLSIQGSHGLSVYLDSDSKGSYSGFFQLDNFPVQYGNGIGNFSVMASLRYDSRDFWSVDMERFNFLNHNTNAGETSFQMAGHADQNGIDVPRIHYSDAKGSLDGNALFSWYSSHKTDDAENSTSVLSGSLVLEGERERYFALAEYAGKRLNVSFTGKGMQIGRLSRSLNNAVADAEMILGWNSLNSFEADLTLNSFNAKLKDNDLQFSALGHFDNNKLRVDNLNVNFSGIEGIVPQFFITLNEGIAHTDMLLRGAAAGKWLDSYCSLNARFKPADNWLGIADALNSINGTLHVERMQYADLSDTAPFDFDFSRSDGNISVSGGPRNMLRLNTDSARNFYVSLSAPSPVRGSVIGKIQNNIINASCNDLYVDLAKVGQLIPQQQDLALTGGYATAEVSISGLVQDPEFYGVIRGNSVRIKVPGFITSDIRLVPFEAHIDGNDILLDPIPTTAGSGAGITRGWFRFDRWIPNIFQLDIFVPPQTPVPFGFDITGFLASGYASGDLTLAMENQILSISGNLYANNAEIGLNTDEIASAQQNAVLYTESSVPVVIDVSVNTGPTVEFLWPSSNIPILRLNPDLGTNVKFTSDSQTQQFSLISDVKIRSGEIYYFERSFYIRSGTLSFRENELRFDPLLTITAEARDRNDDGPVMITMLVDNAPLLSFTARFESRPSLSQNEIFALLGQSLTGSQIDAETGNIQQIFLGSSLDLLAQFGVVRRLERQIRRLTRLDMFSVRTQLLQNMVFSATGLNQTPVDRIAGVGNYFDNTTVFLGKYIGADMFAQTMLALRYNEYKTSYGGLNFEWDIGIELQSPLFSIRWDFVPSHPENWWVNDNSITITFRKTF